MRWFVAVALSGLVAFSNFAAAQSGSTSVEALQAEIARLKEQLAKLEAQLAELQKQQKATEKVTQRFEPITLRGYIQMRYERDSSQPIDVNDLARDRARENFRLRRVRLDVRGTPLKGVLYRLQVDAAETNVALRDAYLELKAGDGFFTFGHFKVPLLEEVLESSGVRWTPERAEVSTRLFPGERDRGIAYTLRKQGLPEITLGLFSGTRRTGTQDSLTSRKSWLIRIVQPLDKEGKLGRIWVGRMDGVGRRDFGAPLGIANFDRERTAVGLLLTPISGLTLRAEWVDGKDAGTAANPTVNVRGWYALLGYKLPDQPITIYAKHDQFDPDRNVARNTFRRNALGIQYDLNKVTKLNLTWEKEKNPSATRWTFQTQVSY
jgi:hypothetical protein